jgi:hypothetical protein
MLNVELRSAKREEVRGRPAPAPVADDDHVDEEKERDVASLIDLSHSSSASEFARGAGAGRPRTSARFPLIRVQTPIFAFLAP